MTANHAHTPTPAVFRRALELMASKYFVTALAREQFLAEYDRMIAQVEAADDLFYDGDTDRPLPEIYARRPLPVQAMPWDGSEEAVVD